VDGVKVENFSAIPAEIILHEAKSIQVDRDGQQLNIAIPPGFIRQMIKQKTPFAIPRIPYFAESFEKGSVGEKAGIRPGDKLISLNGVPTPYFSDFRKEMKGRKNQQVQVGLVRGEDTMQLNVKLKEDGLLGVYFDRDMTKFFSLNTKKYSFFEAIPAGFNKCINTLVKYVQQLRLIFVSKEVKASESLGGFLSIGNLFPGEWDWMAFWEMTALLSIILAFMNILPIPALDGGHVLFLLYEIVTGRKPSEKFLEYAQIVGMVILFGLLLYANGLDLWRNIFSKWFS
jgi:regulator of sigma E protease